MYIEWSVSKLINSKHSNEEHQPQLNDMGIQRQYGFQLPRHSHSHQAVIHTLVLYKFLSHGTLGEEKENFIHKIISHWTKIKGFQFSNSYKVPDNSMFRTIIC